MTVHPAIQGFIVLCENHPKWTVSQQQQMLKLVFHNGNVDLAHSAATFPLYITILWLCACHRQSTTSTIWTCAPSTFCSLHSRHICLPSFLWQSTFHLDVHSSYHFTIFILILFYLSGMWSVCHSTFVCSPPSWPACGWPSTPPFLVSLPSWCVGYHSTICGVPFWQVEPSLTFPLLLAVHCPLPDMQSVLSHSFYFLLSDQVQHGLSSRLQLSIFCMDMQNLLSIIQLSIICFFTWTPFYLLLSISRHNVVYHPTVWSLLLYLHRLPKVSSTLCSPPSKQAQCTIPPSAVYVHLPPFAVYLQHMLCLPSHNL